MSALGTAITIGAALLPPLIEEIQAALDEGLDEKAAAQRALERMRAAELPAPVSDEIARRFAAARAALEPIAERPPNEPIAVSPDDLAIVKRLVHGTVLSHEERGAVGRVLRATSTVRLSQTGG